MIINRIRVSAVIIQNKKLLLVRGNSGFYKDFYFTPGGKIEDGETDQQALTRELHEELSLDFISQKFLFEYEAKNWDGGWQKIKCYLTDINLEKIKLSGEVTEMIWCGRDDFEKNELPISESMSEFLLPKLIKDKYI